MWLLLPSLLSPCHNYSSLPQPLLDATTTATTAPSLQSLQLVSCRNVRNRDLYVLAQSGMHLTSLVLGDDTNKPWVTNRLVVVQGVMMHCMQRLHTACESRGCTMHSRQFHGVMCSQGYVDLVWYVDVLRKGC